jgi:hypothetical protein
MDIIGIKNPYGLIQKAGRKKTNKRRKTNKRKKNNRRTRKVF